MNRSIAKRLKPGTDFRGELEALVQEEGIAAGVILCAVGSLTEASLRMASLDDRAKLDGPFEIVSCTGTLSRGGIHVHLAIADHTGRTYGGHLVSGCIVHTTIELVIGDLSHEVTFDRVHDPATDCKEIVIEKRR
jgi:uncharacterized protein